MSQDIADRDGSGIRSAPRSRTDGGLSRCAAWPESCSGIAAFVWPGIILLVLVILFGAYLLVDGVFALVGGGMDRPGC